MMRHGFGGRPYGADEVIARERREGYVGDFFREETWYTSTVVLLARCIRRYA